MPLTCTLVFCRRYTSLGNPNNTSKNPALLAADASGAPHYKPAWQLRDGSLERDGRR